MYIKKQNIQAAFDDFQQPLGMKLDPKNRWIEKAAIIPWDDIENRYAELFPSKTGNPAKPLRMALGTLLIQKQLNCSDRELIEQIKENPYLQYFIGLKKFQFEAPLVPSLLVEFRKRLTDEILSEINEMIVKFAIIEEEKDDGDNGDNVTQNNGTMMIDATCAPQYIAFPQDINILNKCREDLEGMIDRVCEKNKLEKPRTYRKVARKDYLDFTKNKRRSLKKIRSAIRKQLGYVRRDLGYIDRYIADGIVLSKKDMKRLAVIREAYEQQKTMFENHTHTIPDRIVSLEQPYIRPIVRGKTKDPTEFGAKIDLSVDDNGILRCERKSFSAFNEGEDLISAVERFCERTGHYPERVLADKIYQTRANRKFCDEHGIRLSGPGLGRPKKNNAEDKKIEYQDAVDRIEVERQISLAKRSFGLGCIRTKLATTTMASICLSILAMNIQRISAISFCLFLNRLFSELLSVFHDNIVLYFKPCKMGC